MKKSLLTGVLSVLLSLFASSAFACINVALAINSNVSEGAPSFGAWNVYDANGAMVINGAAEFSAADEHFETMLCLDQGCYALVIDPQFVPEVNSLFGAVLWQNGSILPFTSNVVGNGLYSYTFCVTNGEECPTSIFVGDTNECGTFNFEIGSATAGESVIWNFGNESITGGHFIQHHFTTAGVQLITANYTSDLCPTGVTLTTLLNVPNCETNPVCNLNTQILSQTCGGTVTLVASDFPADAIIHWSVDGVNATNGSEVVLPVDPGTHVICASYETPACPAAVTVCDDVIIEACQVNCDLSISAIQTAPGIFQFNANGSNQNAQLNWYFGNGEAVLGQWSIIHEFAPGTYNVCAAYATGDCAGQGEACITIVVPEVGGCSDYGLAIDRVPNTAGPTSLYWSMASTDGAYSFQGETTYSANDLYYDFNLCLVDGCYNLFICANEPISLENLNIIVPEPGIIVSAVEVPSLGCYGLNVLISFNSICEIIVEPVCGASFETVYTATPGHVEFVNTSTFEGEATFEWSYGDGQISSGPNGNVFYNQNGVYTVCLFITTADGCSSFYCQDVVIETLPSTCTENEVTVVMTGAYPIPNVVDEFLVQLIDEDVPVLGLPTVMGEGMTFTLAGCVPSACYTLAINSTTGVWAADYLNVTVMVNGAVVQALELVENGTLQIGVGTDCVVGVNENEAASWMVYPNPANDFIQVRGAHAENVSIHVYNSLGALVASEKVTTLQHRISTANWPAGYYTVVMNDKGKMFTIPVAIVH